MTNDKANIANISSPQNVKKEVKNVCIPNLFLIKQLHNNMITPQQQS